MMRWLVYFLASFILVGAFWPTLRKLGFGKLPGDIIVKGENYTFNLPVTTIIITAISLYVLFQIGGRIFIR